MIERHFFERHIRQLRRYYELWRDMEAESRRIQNRNLDTFITESYNQIVNMTQILDKAMNSPCIDFSKMEITNQPQPRFRHIDYIEPLITSYCIEYSFGTRWPPGGIMDTSTGQSIRLTNETELYNYLKDKNDQERSDTNGKEEPVSQETAGVFQKKKHNSDSVQNSNHCKFLHRFQSKI